VPPPLRQVTVTALAGEMDAEVARQRAMEERIRKIREAKLKAQAAQAHASQPAIVKHEAPTVNRRTLRLHSQKELQRAFILKEILDRPVGLR
jgi:cellobiose-specific phosphotransferase system component IIA